ncbi:hypothetical protein [Streptomyces sp. 8N706]|uniref:hypothetical protein n=1 Tax=Streptomyces sp. 8N706 TaxID=3457416 RepID=UPI003FD51FC2
MLLSLAACSDGGEPDNRKPPSSPAPSSGSPSPSSDPQAAAEDQALAAYRRVWEEKVKAYAQASSEGTELKKVTTLYALRDIESDLASMRSAKQVTRGKPVLKPEVTALDSKKKIPEATVTDCVDVSKWILVDKASKEKISLPPKRLTKYVSVANLEKWGNKWMVTKLTAQARRC